MSLIAELQRRRVIRAAIAYIVISWVVLQVADIVFPAIPLPDWSMRLLLGILVAIFPVVVVLAWMFQAMPSGEMVREPVRLTSSKLALLVVVAFAIGGGLGLLWSHLNTAEDVPSPRELTGLAVLPLVDMSPGQDQAYFSDGIHEELISRLSEINNVRVPSRTSVASYRGTSKSSREIAEELGVGFLLEGSVRHGADRVLITLQLIDAATDDHVWVRDFDRQLSMENLFDIQRDVAKSIADLLRTQLSPNELQQLGRTPTDNLAAYESWLKAKYHYRRYNSADLQVAIDFFREVTELDPEFASGWSGLANSYMLAATSYGSMDPHIAIELAKEHGAKALALDPYDGATISLIGDIAYWYDFDPVSAEARYLEGIAVDPHHVGNRLSYAYLLGTLGRHVEASKQIEFCLRLEPRAAYVHANGAWRSVAARDYAAVISQANAALAFDPGMTDARFSRGYAYAYLRRFDDIESDNVLDGHAIIRALLYAGTGRLHEARQLAEDLQQQTNRPADIAMIYAILGDKDKAYLWIDRAIEGRHREMLTLRTWELFDPIRDDPRYDRTLRRLGFSELSTE